MRKNFLDKLISAGEAPEWFTAALLTVRAPPGFRWTTDAGQSVAIAQTPAGEAILLRSQAQPRVVAGALARLEGARVTSKDMRFIEQWAATFGVKDVVFRLTEDDWVMEFSWHFEGSFDVPAMISPDRPTLCASTVRSNTRPSPAT